MTIPRAFIENCSIDYDGKHVTASACINGRCYQKTIDTEPMARFIADQLRAYHASLHGDDAVSGLGDYLAQAKHAASRIAASKTVRSLYSATKPILKSAVKELPGGETAFAAAQKTYDIVKKAKQGNPKAQAALRKANQLAKQGDPLAGQLISTAKKLATLHDMKENKDTGNRLTRIEQLLYPLTRTGESLEIGSVASKLKWGIPGYAAYRGSKAVANRLTRKPKKRPHGGTVRSPGHRLAPSRAAAFSASRAPGTPVQRFSIPTAPQGPVTYDVQEADEMIPEQDQGGGVIYDVQEDGEMMEGDDMEVGWYEIESEDKDYDFSGWKEWAYSRPYRGVATAALQGDYGVSASLRSLYSNGLDTILAMGRK